MTRKLEMIRVAVIFLIKSKNVNIELLKTIERKEISTFYLFSKAHDMIFFNCSVGIRLNE